MTATIAPPSTPAAPIGRSRTRQLLGPTIRFVLLLGFLVLVFIPVYVLLVTSFKSKGEISASETWSLPSEWTMDG